MLFCFCFQPWCIQTVYNRKRCCDKTKYIFLEKSNWKKTVDLKNSLTSKTCINSYEDETWFGNNSLFSFEWCQKSLTLVCQLHLFSFCEFYFLPSKNNSLLAFAGWQTSSWQSLKFCTSQTVITIFKLNLQILLSCYCFIFKINNLKP
jgi:hypothetical protein